QNQPTITMSQPWNAFWPPAPANLFVNANLNVVCASKGALPHDTKFADGTKVMRLDEMKTFLAEVTEKKKDGKEPTE
ncbi:MAG: hypothetical protein Q9226_009061, partial [Calogaya cf. arnoldii]